MRAWRCLPMLVLCLALALDLAVPVEPTANGSVEFEDDEEVVQPHTPRSPRPDNREAPTPQRPDLGLQSRPAAPARRALVRRPLWSAQITALEAPSSERASSPPPASEDH